MRGPLTCLALIGGRLLKTTGMGCSEGFGAIRPIASNETLLNLLSLDLVQTGTLREFDLAVIIGKIAFVECLVVKVGEFDKSFNVGVVAQRLTSVVYLPSAVAPRWIGKKENARNFAGFLGDIQHRAFGISPDGMKLCFNENFRPFPDSPAKNLIAAISADVLGDHRETFVGWRALDWSDWNVNGRGVSDDASTERNYVGLYDSGRSHDVSEIIGNSEVEIYEKP
ncbi:MAG: hypothetical protein QOD12_1790 [Verrucomicrobiota bacterium]